MLEWWLPSHPWLDLPGPEVAVEPLPDDFAVATADFLGVVADFLEELVAPEVRVAAGARVAAAGRDSGELSPRGACGAPWTGRGSVWSAGAGLPDADDDWEFPALASAGLPCAAGAFELAAPLGDAWGAAPYATAAGTVNSAAKVQIWRSSGRFIVFLWCGPGRGAERRRSRSEHIPLIDTSALACCKHANYVAIAVVAQGFSGTLRGMAGRWQSASEQMAALAQLWLPVLLWAALIFVLSAQPSLSTGLGQWDFVLRKVAHVFEYWVLTVLVARALSPHIRAPRRLGMVALLAAVGYAATDEWHQTFVPGRAGSPWDVAIDAVGAVSAVLALGSRRVSAWLLPGNTGWVEARRASHE